MDPTYISNDVTKYEIQYILMKYSNNQHIHTEHYQVD